MTKSRDLNNRIHIVDPDSSPVTITMGLLRVEVHGEADLGSPPDMEWCKVLIYLATVADPDPGTVPDEAVDLGNAVNPFEFAMEIPAPTDEAFKIYAVARFSTSGMEPMNHPSIVRGPFH